MYRSNEDRDCVRYRRQFGLRVKQSIVRLEDVMLFTFAAEYMPLAKGNEATRSDGKCAFPMIMAPVSHTILTGKQRRNQLSPGVSVVTVVLSISTIKEPFVQLDKQPHAPFSPSKTLIITGNTWVDCLSRVGER